MDFLKKYNVMPLIDQCVVSGGNALIQVMLLRVLGIDNYGLLAFIMIFVLGLVALNQAIIITPFQVLHSKGIYKDDHDGVINGLQLQVCFFYILILILVGILNRWMHFLSTELVIPSIIYGISYLLIDFSRKKLYVLENYKKLLFQDILVFLIHIGILSLATISNFHLSNILLFIGVSVSVVMIFFWGKWSFEKIPSLVYVEHWGFSKWLIASTVTQWFSGNLIISIAGVIVGNWAVGVIRIGQTINGVLGVLFQLMESYYPSKVAKVFNENGFENFKKYLVNLGVKSVGITAFLALIIMLFSETLIRIIYGEEMAQFAFIMYWFGSLLIVNVLNILLRFYIRTLNLNRLIFESYILLALFSGVTSNYLVENWGIQGVGFGLVVSQILASLWFVIRIKLGEKKLRNSLELKTSIK